MFLRTLVACLLITMLRVLTRIFFLQKRENLRFIKGEKGLSGGRKIADGR